MPLLVSYLIVRFDCTKKTPCSPSEWTRSRSCQCCTVVACAAQQNNASAAKARYNRAAFDLTGLIEEKKELIIDTNSSDWGHSQP